MKNLNFYQYETARIFLKWNGIRQPYGNFKTATAARDFIIDKLKEPLTNYTIATPEGDINLN